MLRKLAVRVYRKINKECPAAMKMYKRYKMYNSEYHGKNRLRSVIYLFRLAAAESLGKSLYRVPLPKGTCNPFSMQSKYRLAPDSVCKAIPDTELLKRKSPTELADSLGKFDVISFDVFDTLIFRPFAKPTDMFYLLGCKLGCFDFDEIRTAAEHRARMNTGKPNFEVNIYDIYREMPSFSSLTEADAEVEIELEREVCYPNPYMQQVYRILLSRGKTLVATSDMYLPAGVISEILEKNGYRDFSKIYVSCEYGYNKSGGKLFGFVKRDFGKNIIHIGDNPDADIRGAAAAGIASYYYEQCNAFGNVRRPVSLISPVSSVYKGVVNNYIYSGASDLSARESFGFIYGGPIVSGFCEWLNGFCHTHGADKIIFLARDMYIFHKIYNLHYREFENEYASASRFSLQELIVEDYPAEFFRHTIKARCDRGYTVKRALREINLEFLLPECESFGVNPKDLIVAGKISRLEDMFIANKHRIAESFSSNEAAAREYFREKLGGAQTVCIADLGWRGSILAYLRFLLVKRWGLCREVKGVLLGSTVNSTSVNLISDGTVTSYAYNHLYNRDFLSVGDWETEYIRILMLEAVFSSDEPSLLEYRLNPEKGLVSLLFYADNPNGPLVREFQRGITKFADEFEAFRRKYRNLYPMSATDAFEPMFEISRNYDYIARIIGDVVDTPFAIAGLNIRSLDYVPLGELMLERNMIKEWPIK